MQHVPEQFTKPPEGQSGERRHRARHSPSALTYVTLGDSNGGIIANISETGMYVTAGEPLRETFLSRVSFRVPQSDAPIQAKGEIVWTSESKKEAGVRFVELREESRELIRKWVTPAQRSRKRVERRAEPSRNEEIPATAPAAKKPASAAPVEQPSGEVANVEPREPITAAPTPAPEPTVAREPARTPSAVARSISVSEKDAAPMMAVTGYGTKPWALTEAQRAAFERLFPSEAEGGIAHASAAQSLVQPAEHVDKDFASDAPSFARSTADTAPENPEVAASIAPHPEPVAERFANDAPSYVRATTDIPREYASAAPASAVRVTTPVAEPEPHIARPAPAEPPASRATAAATTFAGALPRTPMQRLWDAPPPMMESIIGGNYGGGFGSPYRSPTAEPVEETRPRSAWSIAAVTVLVVAACFVIGFMVGPDGVRAWPKVNAAREIIAGEISHLKAVVTGSGGASSPDSATAPPVSSNPVPSGQNAPASASSTLPPSTAAPGSDVPALDAPASGAPPTAAPAAPAASATTTPAENAKPDENASGSNAAPTDADTTGNEVDTTPAAVPPPNRTESAAAKKRELERAEAESKRAAREAQIEKETAAAELYAAERAAEERAAANAAHAAAQPAKPPVTTEPAKPATSSPSRSEAPSTPATHTETAPHPAVATAAPQSYFPVVAPAAGNVPRLIELPEERVIDTAAVVIHSHQYVFVPAEPGPESSHALEKLRIGDRITKMAPMYPAEAAQKAMGGTVHVRATIGKDGKVENVRPINGPLTLITAAVDAIQQWRYRPTLLNQQPIEMQEDFTVEFRPLGLH
ncbi:MAG: TonB family protein [Candidatus Acidiferrales bacterium]